MDPTRLVILLLLTLLNKSLSVPRSHQLRRSGGGVVGLSRVQFWNYSYLLVFSPFIISRFGMVSIREGWMYGWK